MENTEVQKVPVEMSLAEWLGFAKILIGIGKRMLADADEFANVIYIAAPKVHQKALFEEKARLLIAAIRCKIIIDDARDEIKFKVKQAMYASGIRNSCNSYDDKIEHRALCIEKLIRNQSLASIDIKLIEEAKISNDCILPKVRRSSDSEEDCIPWDFLDCLPAKSGLSVKILSDNDLDVLKTMVIKIRQQEFKRKSKISKFMGQKLKLDLPPEVAEYLKE